MNNSGQDYPTNGERRTQWGPATRVLGCGGLTILVLSIAYLFVLGQTTLRGWRVAADSLPQILSNAPAQSQLPPGSRVVFENTTVGVLISQQTQLRQQALGGDLLLFDGFWQDGVAGEKAMSDSSLIGIVQMDSTTGVVRIELRAGVAPAGGSPLGLLRLRPFRHGYRLYREDGA